MLALLDEGDRWHQVCIRAFQQLRLRLLTSEAVLTELFHLIGDNLHAMEKGWSFLQSGGILVASIEHSELHEVHALMSRYGDRPMDLADASLVYLARRERLTTIFTVDHVDFETFRIEGNRRFRIVPSERP